jgi:hypothetical protein
MEFIELEATQSLNEKLIAQNVLVMSNTDHVTTGTAKSPTSHVIEKVKTSGSPKPSGSSVIHGSHDQNRLFDKSTPAKDAANVDSPAISTVMQLPQGTCNVLMVHCEGPHQFFVHHVSSASLLQLKEQGEQMAEYYGDTKGQYLPKKGEFIAAFSKEYRQWFRAQALRVNDNRCLIVFVDYGNVDNCELIYLRPLEEQFKKLPQFAVKCSLFGMTEQQVWYTHIELNVINTYCHFQL